MSDYEAALATLTTPKRLKAELPIPYVFEKLGWRPEVIDGRCVCLCPWHEDNAPSLWTVELEGSGWRWGCWACNLSGDIFDLIQRTQEGVFPLGFSQSIAVAEVYLRLMQVEGWQPPILSEQRQFDPAWARLILREAERDRDGVESFCRAKGFPFGAHWLMTHYAVGAFQGELIVPMRLSNDFVGMKHRRLDGSDKLYSYPGSRLQDTFYGCPSLGADLLAPAPVVLCEGESDVWMADWTLGPVGEYLVLGTAAGASQPPRPAARLAGREVHICFDGDAAGRLGAQRWAEELRRVGCAVTVWDLPEGEDVASLGGISWLPSL